jgi:hypothetical protein
MYVKYDREKAIANGKVDLYEAWAKDFKVDLSKPFLVLKTDHSDYGDRPDYYCEPPPSFRERRGGVYLGSKAFFPLTIEKSLEDYL